MNSELLLLRSKLGKHKKAKIFITGASGFFGRKILEQIIALNKCDCNLNVVALSRNLEGVKKYDPSLMSNESIHWIEGDIENFVFPGGDFDLILHMATATSEETFSGMDQLSKLKSLMRGTERILDFAGASKVKKVLFTSSGVVYGDYSSNTMSSSVPEDYLGGPCTIDIASAVGEGKRVAEYLCSYYSKKYNFDFVIARCFSFSGVGLPLHLHYALGNFIAAAAEGKNIEIKSDGMAKRSYLDIDDLGVWLLTMLFLNTSSNIYNVGSNVEITIKELAEKVSSLINPDIKIKILNNSTGLIGSFHRSSYIPNIERAEKELGLMAWTPLDTSIMKTYQDAYNK